MAFFQNPFPSEFRCNLLLSDRQYNIVFVIPRNAGRGDEIVMAWTPGPYDLSGNDADGNPTRILNICFAQDPDDFRNWNNHSIDIAATASVLTAVTLEEIIADLTADPLFNTHFTAFIQPNPRTQADPFGRRLIIKQRKNTCGFKFYVVNCQAEEVLQFNARAGVAEAPCPCSRDTIANRFNFPEGGNQLIQLDPAAAGGASACDDLIISRAVDAKGNSLGFNPATPLRDDELLRGRSGLFVFKNITVDGSDRITRIIEYQAGATEGMLGKRIDFVYSGANTNPDQVTEVPHCLVPADFVTPP